MTSTFLLEIGLEEMPANDIMDAELELKEKTDKFLKEKKLNFKNIETFSTPRRLAIKINELSNKQDDQTLTVRGPSQKIGQDKDGNWTNAAIGFSKGQGGNVDDLIIKDEKGEPYIYLEKFIPGKKSSDILKDINQVIKNIKFSKHMKWGNHTYQYIRPIHWVVSLLDDEIIPFEIFGIQSSNQTEGHRFLGKKITLNKSNDYEKQLEKEFVIANRDKRKKMIIEQITKLCDEKNWSNPISHNRLLDEVVNLVEYPTTFYGSFSEQFLDVPDQVLEVSMIDHQRYFPVKSKENNKLLPYFISVRNGNEKYIENVAKGNEKVISARLADATFFYHEDEKHSIEYFNEKLKNVAYYDQLGTIYDKELRAEKISSIISKTFDLSNEETLKLKRIATIYKFDLVTQVVDEFPDLQGQIAEVYAKERNEDKEVFEALGEQYLPLSATDELPNTKLGQYISLIDKLDTLIQFFSIDAIPTGSNDPHALRRQAIGIVRLLIEQNTKNIDLENLISNIVKISNLTKTQQETMIANESKLIQFLLRRLDNLLEYNDDISYDVRQAALKASHKNIQQMHQTALHIDENKKTNEFNNTVEAVTRVLNITKNNKVKTIFSEELIKTESEKDLYHAVELLEEKINGTTDINEKYIVIAKMSPLITEFFNQNMVMVEDNDIKENRLALLQKIANLSKKYADFSQIIV